MSARLSARRILVAVAIAAGVAVWVVVAVRLWRTTVPGNLDLPRLDERRYFSGSFLSRAGSYQTFIDVEQVLTAVVLLAVLGVYAVHGRRFMRQSAAGPIGTGMLLGMLGLGLVWLAQLPFGIAGLWWERRHDVAHQGYVEWVVDNFLGLGGRFLFVSLALLIAMGLARWLPRAWWIPGAAVFVGLALLFAFVSPYLIPDVHRLHDPRLQADARRLARAEGVGGTRVDVERVRRFTDAPNAAAVGFGPTKRVIVWDTLLDHRFSRREIDVAFAHEFGHHARRHILKSVAWFALFALPAAFVIAGVTRRYGGMGRPEAVPFALLVLVILQLVNLPFANVRTRHLEREADWAALQTTRDPHAVVGLFRQLSEAALERPDPPGWSVLLNGDHPTPMERIAMAEAWQKRFGR